MQPFNKYYAPDWTPEKGSINKFNGTHAYGARAKKIDQGILVVRFELPYNIWCLGCNNHIGQGVRYNAEKKKVGNYYSTPIMNFRMKCHLCDNYIEIQTDPKNSAYVVVSGARKKMEEWKAEDTEVIQLQDKEVKEKLENDPMYRLEHGIKDKKVIDASAPKLTQLQTLNDSQWSDPYTKSQQLRKQFRQEKKRTKTELDASEKIRDNYSLGIPLLPETSSDLVGAKSISYAKSHLLEKKRLETAVAPLFPAAKKKKGNSSSDHLSQDLSHVAKIRTRLKTDPFYSSGRSTTPFSTATSSSTATTNIPKLNDVHVVRLEKKKESIRNNDDENPSTTTTTTNTLVSYPDSDSD